MTKRSEKIPPREQGLISLLGAIDNQIARQMQRSPAEREEHGVKKWEPLNKLTEELCVETLELFGAEQIRLDALLVAAQAFVKSLSIVVKDLGEDGLGDVRTDYCLSALKKIGDDARNALTDIQGAPALQ